VAGRGGCRWAAGPDGSRCRRPRRGHLGRLHLEGAVGVERPLGVGGRGHLGLVDELDLHDLSQRGGLEPTRRKGLADPAHRVPEPAGVGEPLGRVLGEHLLHQLDDGPGHGGVPLPHRLRLLVDHLVEDRVHRVGLEGFVVGDDLVEDGSQREDVGAGVHPLPHHLLGGHVVGGAHHHAGLGHVRPAQPRQAEVEDLHPSVGLDVDVAGLQVAMDDVLGVGEGQPVADLLHDLELLFEGLGRVGSDQVFEVFPLEQLHGHVDLALLLAEVVDGDDVRVVEAGGGPRLALEALAQLVVGAKAGGDRLDGDKAVQDGILGLVHDAHGPLAERSEDLVLPEPLQLHPGHTGSAERPVPSALGLLRGRIIAWTAPGGGTTCRI
jgi:hypothetical protein